MYNSIDFALYTMKRQYCHHTNSGGQFGLLFCEDESQICCHDSLKLKPNEIAEESQYRFYSLGNLTEEEIIDQVIKKLTPTNISVVEGNFEGSNEIDLSTKDSR